MEGTGNFNVGVAFIWLPVGACFHLIGGRECSASRKDEEDGCLEEHFWNGLVEMYKLSEIS